MKLFKLFFFALALSFVAPQAIDAKPRKHRTTHVKKSKKRSRRCECTGGVYGGRCTNAGVGYDPGARWAAWVCRRCMGVGCVQGGGDCLHH